MLIREKSHYYLYHSDSDVDQRKNHDYLYHGYSDKKNLGDSDKKKS